MVPVHGRFHRHTRRFFIYISILLAALFIAGPAPAVSAAGALAAETAPRPAAQAAVPRFDPGPCSFSETPDLTSLAPGMRVECGWLTVPADHANPNGETIQLAVAIIRSSAADRQPDPVFILQGGPGGSTIDAYLQIIPLDPRLRGLNRDIVLFDQRGTLYTRPTLFCQEVYDEGISALNKDLTLEQANQLYENALRQCHDRLTRDGINLSNYDSLQNAADVDALRQALGYQKINLYGVSYGTLLAVHVQRLYPQILRIVIIDSVVPPQLNVIADQPRVINQGLETLFSACAADAACNRAYPNLKQVFYQQVDRLNANKVHITVSDPRTNQTYPALLDGNTLMSVITQMQYVTDMVPLIPRTIYDARAGVYDVIEKIEANVVFSKSISEGMFYSVWCAEENKFDPGKVDYQGLPPELLKEQQGNITQFVQTCAFWNVEPLPASADAPVQSAIPSLVLAGKFDPVTPPPYAEEVAMTLSNSYFFTFPVGGHGAVTSGPCQDSIFIQFLNNPGQKPDDGCVAGQKMDFSTPGDLVRMPKLINLLNPQGSDLGLAGLLVLALLFLLTSIIVYPLVWLVRLARRGTTPSAPPPAGAYGAVPQGAAPYAPPAQPLRKPFLYRPAPWLAVLAGIMLAVFVVAVYAMSWRLALSNDSRILFGLPGTARPLFGLAVLAAVFVLLMLLGAVAAWARRAGSAWGRVYLTLLSLAGIACLFVLASWGAIQGFFWG